MIGQIVAHGRTAQDRRNLNAHLWKTAGQVPSLIEQVNVAGATTDEALQVMQILRSARGAVRIGFWHIVLSPRTLLGPAERHRAIAAVVAEFGAMEDRKSVV